METVVGMGLSLAWDCVSNLRCSWCEQEMKLLVGARDKGLGVSKRLRS